jgi:hypothetical protein
MIGSFPILLLSFLSQGAGSTEAPATFDERLKHATGPSQLRQLERWCANEKMPSERKKVEGILAKIGQKPDPREPARAAGDQARQAVLDFRERRAKAIGEDVRRVLS